MSIQAEPSRSTSVPAASDDPHRILRWLTYMMFMMFAMTTDAVGVIIPEIMATFQLSMTQAGMIHYGPMIAIALAGLAFGFLADTLGRKTTIGIGLALFAVVCFSFILGNTFYYFLSLMMLSGVAIGIFKTAALALIGDISRSTTQHTSTMNGVEAFFGVGAIIGPLIVTYMLTQGVEWKWLYFVAGCLCVVLIIMALKVDYPEKVSQGQSKEKVNLRRTFSMLKDPYALAFSVGAFLYVATESAVYVWMPTYLLGYSGSATLLAIYALPVFFVLRALGRFMGIWLMAYLNWRMVLLICSGAVAFCFVVSIVFGENVAVFFLPLSGIFMSVIYPTLNSKGISCFARNAHGTVAGVILFFTAMGAAFGPLVMGVVSDSFGGQAIYGFIVASVFALLLFAGLVYNYIFKPVEKRLEYIEAREYGQAPSD